MRKFWIILITMAAVLVGSVFTAETALAFSVTGIGRAQYLSEYGSSELKSSDADGEQVVFSRDSKGNLYLYDQYKSTKYMSFKETFKGMTEYSITRINFQDPQMTVWEISVSTGHAGTNQNYWIVGKKNGQWVTYVSRTSLENMGGMRGYPTVYGRNENGNFVIYCADHKYPKAGPYLKMVMFWDPQAEWMGLKVI